MDKTHLLNVLKCLPLRKLVFDNVRWINTRSTIHSYKYRDFIDLKHLIQLRLWSLLKLKINRGDLLMISPNSLQFLLSNCSGDKNYLEILQLLYSKRDVYRFVSAYFSCSLPIYEAVKCGDYQLLGFLLNQTNAGDHLEYKDILVNIILILDCTYGTHNSNYQSFIVLYDWWSNRCNQLQQQQDQQKNQQKTKSKSLAKLKKLFKVKNRNNQNNVKEMNLIPKELVWGRFASTHPKYSTSFINNILEYMIDHQFENILKNEDNIFTSFILSSGNFKLIGQMGKLILNHSKSVKEFIKNTTRMDFGETITTVQHGNDLIELLTTLLVNNAPVNVESIQTLKTKYLVKENQLVSSNLFPYVQYVCELFYTDSKQSFQLRKWLGDRFLQPYCWIPPALLQNDKEMVKYLFQVQDSYQALLHSNIDILVAVWANAIIQGECNGELINLLVDEIQIVTHVQLIEAIIHCSALKQSPKYEIETMLLPYMSTIELLLTQIHSLAIFIALFQTKFYRILAHVLTKFKGCEQLRFLGVLDDQPLHLTLKVIKSNIIKNSDRMLEVGLKTGDPELMQHIVNKQPNLGLETRDTYLNYIFHNAYEKGDIETIQIFIKECYTLFNGWYSIGMFGSIELFKFVVEKVRFVKLEEVSIILENNDIANLIRSTAKFGKIQLLKYLYTNHNDLFQQTPLIHFVTHSGSPDVFDYIIANSSTQRDLSDEFIFLPNVDGTIIARETYFPFKGRITLLLLNSISNGEFTMVDHVCKKFKEQLLECPQLVKMLNNIIQKVSPFTLSLCL